MARAQGARGWHTGTAARELAEPASVNSGAPAAVHAPRPRPPHDHNDSHDRHSSFLLESHAAVRRAGEPRGHPSAGECPSKVPSGSPLLPTHAPYGVLGQGFFSPCAWAQRAPWRRQLEAPLRDSLSDCPRARASHNTEGASAVFSHLTRSLPRAGVEAASSGCQGLLPPGPDLPPSQVEQ